MASNTSEQPKENLVSRLFRRGSKANDNATTVPETASTFSDTTLVPQEPRHGSMKPASKEELTTYQELMAKAVTMNQDEFKAYLQDHKTQADAVAGRRASEGWIKKDETGRYDVISALHNFVSITAKVQTSEARGDFG